MSYFSGRLTLTLDRTYLQEENGENIFIVDPLINYFYEGSIVSKAMTLIGYPF